MRNLIKKILPKPIFKLIRRIKWFFTQDVLLIKFYIRDFKRFLASSYKYHNHNSEKNLSARITVFYHSIEKGLSHPNLRYKFGKNAMNALFEALEEFVELGYDQANIRFQTALSVIDQYIHLHEENGIDVPVTKTRLSRLQLKLPTETFGGSLLINRNTVLSQREANFSDFSKARFSVRDYSDKKVEHDIIFKSIQLSMKAPSVCNRQAWKVYVIENQELMQKVLELQGGLTGNGHNISYLLVVCSDNRYFGGAEERNQSFIDGGLFSMNLLYSLEYHGVASCALNANLKYDNEIKIRDLIGVEESEDIIMFISTGDYPEHFKVPKSQRDSYMEITKHIA